MPERKKILLISSEFPPNVGGIGNHAFHLANSLQQNNFVVTVVADIIDIPSTQLQSFHQSISFNFIPVQRQKSTWKTYIERVQKSLYAAKECNYIICSGKFSLWQLHLLKKKFPRKKYIAIVHGSELDLKRNFARKLVFGALKKCDAIIAVSNYTKSYIPAVIQSKIPCHVIPNGIHIKEFTGHHSDTITLSPLKLITIGSVTERKGQENVIRALPEIIKAFPDVEYHIVGKPVMKDSFVAIAEKLEVADHIFFHGAIDRDELLQILSKSHVKLMLSNHTAQGDFEGFGIAILEANAAGKPAIGANFGGITDAIKDGYNGVLVDVKDNAAIKAALINILDEYTSYGEQSILWAKQHDWSIIVQQYIQIINNLH